MQRRYSIRELARHLDLSICTVSKALNSPEYPMAEATRKRVREAAALLNYEPNINAKRLFSRRSGNIGLVTPSSHGNGGYIFADKHLARIISGMEAVLQEHRFRLLILFQDREFIENREFLRLFRQDSVDGLLIWGAGPRESYWAELAEQGFPHLFLTTSPDGTRPENCYSHDYEQGAARILQHLLEKGYRRILWCAPVEEDSLSVMLRAGFRRTLEKFHLDWHSCIREKRCQYGVVEGIAAGEEILREFPDADAILTTSGNTASGIRQCFALKGIPVPGRYALACCDSLADSETTICRIGVDDLAFGKTVAERLIADIENGPGAPLSTRYPVSLFPGNTC